MGEGRREEKTLSRRWMREEKGQWKRRIKGEGKGDEQWKRGDREEVGRVETTLTI